MTITDDALTLPLLMKVDDVMRELAIGRRSVYELVKDGKLNIVRVGLRNTRFKTEEVLALAEAASKPMRLPNLRNQKAEDGAADAAP
jgi:excisionase family DNA binding protein